MHFWGVFLNGALKRRSEGRAEEGERCGVLTHIGDSGCGRPVAGKTLPLCTITHIFSFLNAAGLWKHDYQFNLSIYI